MPYTISPPAAATHQTPRRCSPGTTVLLDAIEELCPNLEIRTSTYGCFNRRPITGGTAKSVHGDGRAFDVGHGFAPTDQQRDEMALLVWRLTAGCYVLGVCRLLFNRHSWQASRGWRASSSMGGPHLDHLHGEQMPIAAWSRPPSIAVVRCALGLP